MKHICPLCKSEYDKADDSHLSEKDKYLLHWNYTLGTPEAEEAWKAKESMTRKQAPMIQSDIQGYVSQIDGTYIESRSKPRAHLKQHDCIGVGHEKLSNEAPKQDPKLKQRIAEIAYEKLRYR